MLQDMVLSAVASLLCILLIRWLSSPIPGFTRIVLRWIGLSVVASFIGFTATRSPRVVMRYLSIRSTVRLLGAVLIKEAILSICILAGLIQLPTTAYAVLLVLADLVVSLAALLIIRFFAAELTLENERVASDASKSTALIAGTGDDSVRLAMQTEKEGKIAVVGFISSNKEEEGLVLGNKIVYYCPTAQSLDSLQWRLGGVDSILFPKAGISQDDESAGSEDDLPQTDAMTLSGHVLKRSFDLVLSALLLIVFSPVMALCAIAIRIEDGEPVLYRQERVGRGGRKFNILKFRSMRLDAEAGGCPALYSGDDDPRLTRVGKFLRQHHLDELPQLWNVFRGDMSFIGYRPEREYYINQIMERNPRYRYLYQIRPGVTSYATLYNGYTDSLEKMLTRLDLDLYYLRNHSVWFDVKVLGLTFLSIVSGRKF